MSIIDHSISKSKYVTVSVLVVTTCITIGLSVFLVYNHEYVVKLEHHGYLGLFLISLLAGSPLPIPTPSMVLTFTLASILNPLYIGLVSGLGNTIGNVIIYYTGRAGLKVFDDFDKPDSRIGRVMRGKRVSRLVESKSWGEMAIVFLSFIYPNPVSTPLILAMGAARFNLTKFIVICWSGKTVQGLVFAYLGHFGLRSLLHFLGVFHLQ
jgi:membrane protein YqaA with SNARE-associated domain